MTRHRAVIWSALLLMILSLTISGNLQPALRGEYDRLELGLSPGSRADLPPEIAVMSVALGSFRGLLVHYLWERMVRLDRERKFYEAVQLGRWITSLQGKYPRVWAHMAWNMRANIASACHSPGERWTWIQAALRLLRDEGIPRNPLDMELHRETAWTFLHKLTDLNVTDEYREYYKRRHLQEWERILGRPPEETEARIAEFRRVAGAPRTVTALVAEHPGLEARLDALEEDVTFDAEFLEEIRLGHVDDEARLAKWIEEIEPGDLRALIDFLRARVIRQTYRMDPDLMLDLMVEIGPLDWRHTASHALYWIAQGVLRFHERTQEVRILRVREIAPGETTNDVRDICAYQSSTAALKLLLETGVVRYFPSIRDHVYLPDVRFLDAYILSISERLDRGVPPELRENLRRVLEGLAWQAYFGREEEQTALLLGVLQEHFGSEPGSIYGDGPEGLVDGILVGALEDPRRREEFLAALLIVPALEQGLANDRRDVYERYMQTAREAHREVGSPEAFETLVVRVMGDRYFRRGEFDVFARSRAWRALDPALRKELWPVIEAHRAVLSRELERREGDFKTAFPQPE